jgi:uncharacterized protein (TIGR01319 family)
MMLAELVDFGSTFTKVRLVDLGTGQLMAASQSRTTATTHLLDGYRAARAALGPAWEHTPRDRVRASSSAAGGLKMVAVGLVPALTLEAARTAAMGAGARVVGAYGYRLGEREVAQIEGQRPDIVLLAGGTDGGDAKVILHNARQIAASAVSCPVIVAGNKEAADEAVAILRQAGQEVHLADNVLPELDRLCTEPTSRLIREIFAREIVRARGLADAEELSGAPVLPTPLAVLRGAQVLADGAAGQAGFGEMIVVDVGGATTDVHSVADGNPSSARTVVHGIPEPRVKRTVEGDLGIRVNAVNVAELLETRPPPGDWDPAVIRRARESAPELAAQPSALPEDAVGAAADELLAATALFTAVSRHAGRLRTAYGPRGQVTVQTGKDLTTVHTVIGTGGIFSTASSPAVMLQAVLATEADPESLRPAAPALYADSSYCLYAIGLLADSDPEIAVAFGRSTLVEVGQ